MAAAEREMCYRQLTVRHRGRVLKTKREKIPMEAALHEIGGDAESNHGRLRCGAPIKRQKIIGKHYPVYVRFEYRTVESVDGIKPQVRTFRVGLLDPGLSAGGTL